nr:MAG TPA: minor capsid protein [Microviridae sp.]
MLGAILGGIGSIASSLIGASQADQQADLQKEFAKNAIQWKVKDATKAGLHPLAALGANTMSYSPVSVGVPDLGAMGQDVGRSIMATQNSSERAVGELGKLQLERAGLENDLLRTQIASENTRLAGQIGPPMPTDGGLTMGGHHIKTDPGTSNMQQFEDRYGDASDVVLGPMIAWQDLKKNIGSMSFPEILRAIDNMTKIPATQGTYKYKRPAIGGGGGW